MIIQRGKLSSASVRVLGVSGLRLGPASFLFPFRRVGEALLLRTAMLGAARRFGSAGAALLVPGSPSCSSSSLPHQQHGESRRVKENKRGNGAREVGFKPPLTTDKQQQREEAGARRKAPGICLRARTARNRTQSRLHLGAKNVFSSSPMFCFSRFGTARAPGNGLRYAIGRP